VVGDGARPSRTFGLPLRPSGATANLAVSPSSKGWFVGGIVFVSVGGPVLVVGLLVALAGAVASSVNGSSDTTAQDWKSGGLATAAVGAVGVVAGIVAIVSNAHSDVSFGPPAEAGHDERDRPTRAAGPPPLAFPEDLNRLPGAPQVPGSVGVVALAAHF
jgi:hypothetical protein